MSDSTNTSPISPIKHNVYFEGNVQSLAIETEKGPATIGVMKKGKYVFNTSTPETIIVISGIMNTKLNDSNWQQHPIAEPFHFRSGVSFDVDCETDVAYICYYA